MSVQPKIYTVKRKPYFYDSQLKRYIVQLLSLFAGYSVRTGRQRDGEHRFIDVPVVYGGMSRTAAYTLTGGNENIAATIPKLSLKIGRAY